jgi:assimilatory nitrate reductase catalytic subunit
LFRAAARADKASGAPAAAVIEAMRAVEEALGLLSSDPTLLRYADPARGQRRTLRLHRDEAGDVRLQAFALAGDAAAEPWVQALLQGAEPVQSLAKQLLRPGAAPTTARAPRTQVCNCFDVDEASITACLAQTSGSDAQRLAHLQKTLKCGTQCGSCLPALRRMAMVSHALA